MDETRTTNHVPRADDEISLLDLVIVLAKHKKLVLGLPLIAAIVAAIVSLLMTPIYTATTKILPPQQQQSTAAAMLGQLGALAGAAGGTLGIKNPADLYVGMLKSRTVADSLIERFDLAKLYEKKLQSAARKTLEKVTDVKAGKDGLITIDVDDTSPQRAAALANAYIEELTKLTSVLAVTEAAQRRLFFERQLLEAKNNLVKAEISARRALNQGGIAMVDEQGRSMVETTAALRAQIAAKEVQIGSMKAFATDQNPEFVKARQELAALKQQMARIEGAGEAGAASGKASTSEQGLRNLALLRDVKYYEVLFELLAKQYELAKIDEAKEGAVIQIVDKAVVPDRRSSPKRSLIVMLATLVAGVIAVLLVFIKEFVEKARRNRETSERLELLRHYLGFRGK